MKEICKKTSKNSGRTKISSIVSAFLSLLVLINESTLLKIAYKHTTSRMYHPSFDVHVKTDNVDYLKKPQ